MLEYAVYYIVTERFLVAWRREREGGGNDPKNKLQKEMKKLLEKIENIFVFIVYI